MSVVTGLNGLGTLSLGTQIGNKYDLHAKGLRLYHYWFTVTLKKFPFNTKKRK